MENYNLISCNPSLYPSILCRAWDGAHPLSGNVVYIAGSLDGQPQDPAFTYQLISIGTNVCVSNDWLPALARSSFNTCTPENTAGWKYVNCETREERVFYFNIADPANRVLRIDGSCDCWELIGESNAAEQIVSNYSEYNTCFDCIKARDSQNSPTAERTLSYAIRLQLPKPLVPDRGFKECCYKSIVLASSADSEGYKNDFTGVYFKRPTLNSTVVFTLLNVKTQNDYILNDATYGTFKDFGTAVQPDLSFFILDWRKVLLTLGEGSYQIVREISIAGQIATYPSNTFNLKEFSVNSANYTIRIDAYQNGEFTRQGVDFSGTGFKTSLRLDGFFGRKEWEYTQNKLVDSNYKSSAPSSRIDSTYVLQGSQLPDCIAVELMEFLVVGSLVKINDYNKNNHSYEIVELGVTLEGNQGTTYSELTRKATFNLSFSERDKNNRIINCK